MTAPRDAFALGGIDPLIALGAEKTAITTQLDGLPDDAGEAVSGPLVNRLIEIEDRIAAAVPLSAAGAIVQIKRLTEYARDFEWCEHHDSIVSNLIAGLEQLAEAGAR